MSSLYDSVVEVCATRFNIDRDKVQPDVSFEDLGLDSLSQIELATALQRRLGVQFTDDDLDEMSTVADVVAKLEEKGVAV